MLLSSLGTCCFVRCTYRRKTTLPMPRLAVFVNAYIKINILVCMLLHVLFVHGRTRCVVTGPYGMQQAPGIECSQTSYFSKSHLGARLFLIIGVLWCLRALRAHTGKKTLS